MSTRGFAVTWFPNDTRVLGWSSRGSPGPRSSTSGSAADSSVGIRSGGTFTWPRRATWRFIGTTSSSCRACTYGSQIHTIARGIRKVILNQGAGHPPPVRSIDTPYRHPDVVAVMVGAEEARDFLAWGFPGLKLHLVPFAVDGGARLREEKKRQIAFMPRRNEEHARLAVRLLEERGTLGGFVPVPIDNRSEVEVAELVGASPDIPRRQPE